MIVFPNAKINLGLNVLNRRDDGFHNIQTIFYPVPLKDILEIVPSRNDQISLTLTGIPLPEDQSRNLCYQAWELLKKDFDIPPVCMHLHKMIPPGSGLGGGSSDAAFTLVSLNKLFGLQLSLETLTEYARQLGSDCPFFLINQPMFASGRGDVLERIDLDLGRYFLVIVFPGIHVSTSWAYSQIKPRQSRTSLHEIIRLPIQQWNDQMQNDFEEVIFYHFPEIARIKAALYREGALFALMSGSGSAVFGLFDHPVYLQDKFMGMKVWASWVNS